MVRTASGPGAGDPDGIRHLARIRAAKASSLRDVVASLRDSQRAASGPDWKGKSKEAFVAKVDTLLPDLDLLANGLDVQAAALGRYASAVEHIQSQVVSHQSSLSHAYSELRKYQGQLDNLDVFLLHSVQLPSRTPWPIGPVPHRTSSSNKIS